MNVFKLAVTIIAKALELFAYIHACFGMHGDSWLRRH